jgi:hypothetical protein
LVAAVVEMVSVAVPTVMPVMLIGLVEPKLKVGRYWAPAGLEVTTGVSAMLPVKPPVGVTVIVEEFPELAPRVTVTVVPLIVKLGAGRLMVYVALATALLVYPERTAIARIVSVDDTVIEPVYNVQLGVGVVALAA